MSPNWRALAGALALIGVFAGAAKAAETRKVFVGCPILRNTEAPCWLGQSAGTLYFLGAQGDLTSSFYPPQFQHRMLVEGVATDAPRICGGVVLKSVTVSVLPELDPSCNVMLPAEAYANPPNDRLPGPSGVRGAAPPPPPPPRAAPAPFAAPFGPRRFEAPFNADTERLWAPAQTAIKEALRYAQAAKARRITVTGARATMRLSDGGDYVERADIAERRARAVEITLRQLGLPEGIRLEVHWDAKAAASDGSERDAERRRVIITVDP